MRLVCRLTGKLSDGTIFADHQADDNLLRVVVGEGELRSIVNSVAGMHCSVSLNHSGPVVARL